MRPRIAHIEGIVDLRHKNSQNQQVRQRGVQHHPDADPEGDTMTTARTIGRLERPALHSNPRDKFRWTAHIGVAHVLTEQLVLHTLPSEATLMQLLLNRRPPSYQVQHALHHGMLIFPSALRQARQQRVGITHAQAEIPECEL